VIQDVRPVARKGRNMVGPAFTLRYMPAREDRNTLAEFRNPKHMQRQAIEQCPPGSVLIMDCRRDARAASSGDILIKRLMVRGAASCAPATTPDRPSVVANTVMPIHVRIVFSLFIDVTLSDAARTAILGKILTLAWADACSSLSR